MKQPDRSSNHPASARRFLSKPSPNGVLVLALIGMLVGGGAAFLLLRGRLVLGYSLVLTILCGFVGMTLLLWLFPPATVCVFVGVDGVVVWGRFIPYSEIKGLHQEWRYEAAGSEGHMAWPAADIWSIFLDLRGGESVLVESLNYDRSNTNNGVPEHQDDRGAEVMQAIEAGLAAWLAKHDRPELSQEDLLARGERTYPEWVEALRGFGLGATAAYRRLSVDREGLSRVLAEPLVRPSTRAAAAVALAATGDESAGKKLRIAAAEVANPRLRIALENVADEAKGADVVEALEVLEAVERDARTSRTV